MASRPPVSDRINESLSFGDNNREAHFRHRLLRTRTDRTPLRIGNARGSFFSSLPPAKLIVSASQIYRNR
jgi:hypothetical protein